MFTITAVGALVAIVATVSIGPTAQRMALAAVDELAVRLFGNQT